MPRLLPLATAVAVAVTGAVVSMPAASAEPGDTAARKVATRFAFKSVTYGSRVNGGDIPASSGTTSYQAIGCTNKAGRNNKNYVASVAIPDFGRLEGVTSRNWTKRKGSIVSSNSRNAVAQLVLAESSFGRLEIHGIKSVSKAWHDSKDGYHAETTTNIGGLRFTDSEGETQDLAIPTPDQPILIPGLLKISIGMNKEKVYKRGAYAAADTLDIRVYPTNSRFRIAHSAAKINEGVKAGVFSGMSNATRVSALDGIVTSGPQPAIYMPCQGTYGKIREKSIAGVDLGGQVVVDGLQSRQWGKQKKTVTKGFEEGRIATVNLGDGQLVLKGVVARAAVERTKGQNGKPKRSAAGTTVGSITVDGEERSFPELDGLEIPGLAKVETKIVEKTWPGLRVTAVRITLLDGSGAVIDLGQAKMSIFSSGR